MDPVTSLDEIKQLVVEQGNAIDAWKKQHKADLGALVARVDAMTLAEQRNALFGRPSGKSAARTPAPVWYDAKSKQRVHVLGATDNLAAAFERTSEEPTPSLGRVLRGIVTGGRADDANELAAERKALAINDDSAGGYTVGGRLAAQWIDALRAQMVLTRAGATTVPMDNKTLTIAKLTADAASSWHAENATITDTAPTFGAVELSAKTIVTVVKLSLELSQDSANIESMLQRALTNATARAIYSAGMNGVTAGAAAAPAGIFNAAGRNKVTSIGAPTSWDFAVDGLYELMLDNVALEDIGALIAHPAVFKKMRKLKTGLSSDNTSLVPPPEVAALPKLWTTAAPLAGGTTAAAMLADWRDLLFGVRQNITVRVLSEAFMGSNLQVAVVCYARCDFAPAREQSFCSLEGITV